MSGRCLWSVWNSTSSKLRRSNISQHFGHIAKCSFSSGDSFSYSSSVIPAFDLLRQTFQPQKCGLISISVIACVRPILRATDLRGGVVGLAGPLVGVGVALFEVKPNKTFRLVRQTVTAPDGKYYFNNVHPGQYVLRIGGINYPLEVGETQMQDIPVIAPPRH
jgi:hypothetical protein